MNTKKSRFIGVYNYYRIFTILILLLFVMSPGMAKALDLPLEPSRELHFTTDEGTWMSLDISPDGRTIVFDLLGDLYLLSAEGGVARPISSGIEFDAQPRFSPDGGRIVFLSDRSGSENIWIMDLATEEVEQLSFGDDRNYRSPEWMPNGSCIVVASQGSRQYIGPAQLWRYCLDGAEVHQLLDDSRRDYAGLAFGNDEDRLWYSFRAAGFYRNLSYPVWQIGYLDVETSAQTVVTARQGSAFRPTLSPDGRWLVYGTRYETETGLRIRDLATQEERWLAYPVQYDAQDSKASMDLLPGFSFTPDSQAVIASFDGGFWRIPINSGSVEAIPFVANVSLELGPELRFSHRIIDEATFTARRIRDLSFSPDGHQLAFSAVNAIWVMDFPDGTPRRLTNVERRGEGEFYPTWSPAGDWIAYVTLSDEVGGHIEKVRVADAPTNPVQLTERRALYQDPVWSPDESYIVATRGRTLPSSSPERTRWRELIHPWLHDPVKEFVRIPSDGGAATTIRTAENMGLPHFVAGSDRVFAFGRREGLVSFNIDGSDFRRHLQARHFLMPSPTQNNAPAPPSFDSQVALGSALTIARADGEAALVYSIGMLYSVDIDLGRAEAEITLDPALPEVTPLWPHKMNISSFGWTAGPRLPFWVLGKTVFVRDEAGGVSEHAIDVSIESARPTGRLLLSGARIITMNGDEIFEQGDLLIVDNRIEQITNTGGIPADAYDETIDLRGKTIIPGMVEIHGHPWTDGDEAQQPADYLANLAYGITTLHAVGAGAEPVLGLADRIQAGLMIGPRVFNIANIVRLSDANLGALDHALQNAQYGDFAQTKMWSEMQTRTQRQWSVLASENAELMITAHIGGGYDAAITNILDGYTGLEHNIPLAPLHNDVVTLAAHTGITYTPTLVSTSNGPSGDFHFFLNENPVDDPKLRRFTPEERINLLNRGMAGRFGRSDGVRWTAPEEFSHIVRDAEFITRLVEAGGRAGLGGHGNLQGLASHWELWLMASGGLSNHDALRVATIFGAEAIGRGEDIGSLEPGKLADLVILNENPLDDIRNTNTIAYVMVNGRLYNGDTLDEVWPEQRELPSFSWQSDPPPNADLDLEDRWPLSQH